MRLVSIISIASSFLIASSSQAFSLVGRSSGSWSMPSNPSASTSITSIAGGTNNRLAWGRIDNCGTCTPFNNYVQIDGVDFNASSNAFKLADISFRNGSVWDGALGDFALSLKLFINGEIEGFSYILNVLNTPNTTNNPVLDGDKLRFTTNQRQTFANNGGTYALDLLGFGVNYSREFNAPESTTTTTGLYAQIVQLEAPQSKKISDPSFIVGLLILGCYFFMTRNKHK